MCRTPAPAQACSFVKLPVMPARNVCPVHVVADRLFVVDNAAGELTWSALLKRRNSQFHVARTCVGVDIGGNAGQEIRLRRVRQTSGRGRRRE
jgi:hypothetical protein